MTQGPLESELSQLGTDHPDRASSGHSRSAEKVTRESWGPSACREKTCPRVNRSHLRFPKAVPTPRFKSGSGERERERRVGRGRSPPRSDGYFPAGKRLDHHASILRRAVCTASGFPGPEPSPGRPRGTSRERRSRGARPRRPRVLGNASSQLPRIRPRQARPEGALGRPRGCTGTPGPSDHAGPGGAAGGGAGPGWGRPRGSLRLTVCSCSSDRARGSSSSNNAAAAATPGAPGSGLILRAPTGRAPAHRLLLRRRRRRFTSTGRGQTHGARTQPLPPPPSPPAPCRPRPPASEPLPLTQPRHPATPAHAGSPPDAGPQPSPAVGRRRAQAAGLKGSGVAAAVLLAQPGPWPSRVRAEAAGGLG